MTPEQLETLKKFKVPTPNVEISWDDVSDGDVDRTLLLGHRKDGRYIHTYLESSRLCCMHYTASRKLLYFQAGNEMDTDFMVPDFVYPVTSDHGFCLQILKQGVPLNFAEGEINVQPISPALVD